MDYHAVHGHDVTSFGLPLTHRVLTVSAADVDTGLLSQSSAASSTTAEPPASTRFVPTGLDSLDAILSGSITAVEAGEVETNTAEADVEPGVEPEAEASTTEVQEKTAQQRPPGGIRRGQLTEIWGPPGVGKTAFGMQLAANALRNGGSAVWVDCFHPLPEDRFAAIAEASVRDIDGHKSVADGFARYVCPSLPHFIAMLCPRPFAAPPCIPSDASILVIDSLSSLVNYALPRTADRKGAPLMANGKRGPAPYEKRAQVLQFITAALERLAETHNLAVVLLTQCASRIQAERGAALVPAINAVVWDRGISARLVLFRDWAWKDNKPVGGRFVGIQKLHGTGGSTTIDHAVAFDITETGLVEEHYSAMPTAASIYKRKLGETGLEAEGDDENYGWDDADSMPNMPQQWQGSEDLLLGYRYEEEEDAEEEDEEAKDEDGEEDNEKQQADEESSHEAEASDRPRRRRSLQSVADSEEDSDL